MHMGKPWKRCEATLATSGSMSSEGSAAATSESRDEGAAISSIRMPWQGRSPVNIQPVRGMAKPYQVRQALKAIDWLEEMNG